MWIIIEPLVNRIYWVFKLHCNFMFLNKSWKCLLDLVRLRIQNWQAFGGQLVLQVCFYILALFSKGGIIAVFLLECGSPCFCVSGELQARGSPVISWFGRIMLFIADSGMPVVGPPKTCIMRVVIHHIVAK